MVLAWVAAPIGLAGWFFTRVSPREIAAPSISWQTVRAAGPSRSPITVSPVGGHTVPLVAPSWAGMVERSTLRAGTSIADGDIPVVIGGIGRMAVSSDEPFTRRLENGASGADVLRLNSLLRRRGFEASAGAEFANATQRGVVALAALLNAPRDGVFDPNWLIFLPASPVTVAEVSIFPSQPAPAVGSQFATIAAPADAAVLVNISVASAPDGTPHVPTERERVRVPDNASLEVDGTPIELAESRNELSPEGLQQLIALGADLSSTVEATVVEPPAAGAIEVPAASVRESSDGRPCVVTRTGTGSAVQRGVPVVVVSSKYGRTQVIADLGSGARVALGPASADSCR
jgi:hypothetical protein